MAYDIDISQSAIQTQIDRERRMAEERKARNDGQMKWLDNFPWHPNKEEQKGGLSASYSTVRILPTIHTLTEEELELLKWLGPPLDMGLNESHIGKALRFIARPVILYQKRGIDRSTNYVGLGFGKQDGNYICPFFRDFKSGRKGAIKPRISYAINAVPTRPDDIDKGVRCALWKTEWQGRKVKDGSLACYGAMHYYMGYEPEQVAESEAKVEVATIRTENTPAATRGPTRGMLPKLAAFGERIVGIDAQDIVVYKRLDEAFGKMLPMLDLAMEGQAVAVVRKEDSIVLPEAYLDQVTDSLSDPRYLPGFADDGNVFYPQLPRKAQVVSPGPIAGGSPTPPAPQDRRSAPPGPVSPPKAVASPGAGLSPQAPREAGTGVILGTGQNVTWISGGVEYAGRIHAVGDAKSVIHVREEEQTNPEAKAAVATLVADPKFAEPNEPGVGRARVENHVLRVRA